MTGPTGWHSRGEAIKSRLFAVLEELNAECEADGSALPEIDTSGHDRPERLDALTRQFEYHYAAGQMAELSGDDSRAARHYQLFVLRLRDYLTEFWAWIDTIRAVGESQAEREPRRRVTPP